MKINSVYEILWSDITCWDDQDSFDMEGTDTMSIGVLMKETNRAIWLVHFINEAGDRDYTYIPKGVIKHKRCLGSAHIVGI